jgi:DNA-binding SARP family transcriptional activator
MPVEFAILGPLQVLRAGTELSCRGNKQRALLADLLIHANQVISVDRLIDDLWGEKPPDTASNALQVYIAGLRRLLGEDAAGTLLTRRPGYTLLVGTDSLDLFRFQSAVHAGRAVMQTDPATAAARFTEALALWRGRPFADLTTLDFAMAEMTRLEELQAAAVEDLVEMNLVLGRNEEALEQLHPLIADNPLRERPRYQLMLAMYRSGRQAEALATYRAFRDQMAEELGIEPGAALRELESAILNQDSSLTHPGLVDPPSVTADTESGGPVARSSADSRVSREGEPQTKERKYVTVMWCGVAPGAVEPGADVEDQSDRTEHVNTVMTRVVESHGGTVELVAGDALLAVFGAPASHEDDPERAIRASLRLVETLAAPGDRGAAPARVGVATGEALVTTSETPVGTSRVAGNVVAQAFQVYERAPFGSVTLADSTHRVTERLFDCQPVEGAQSGDPTGTGRMWTVVAPAPQPDAAVTEAVTGRCVGRDFERALLASTLARSVRASVVQLVTIIGDPGMGKTRLVSELLRHAEASREPIHWLQGRCLAYGEGAGLAALRQIVKSHLGILDTDPPDQAADKLDRAIPGDHPEAAWLRRRLRPLIGAEAPTADRQENFTAWRKFLELVADGAPAVVVFEDLHWADEALLAFLEHTVEFAQDVPILLVATARPELFDHVPRWSSAIRNSTRVDLAPMSRPEMRELIAQLLGRDDLPAELEASLLSHAGGNPLYAAEFVSLLRDQDVLAGKRLDRRPGAAAQIPVPSSVRDTIAARLDTLPMTNKRVLQDAAVIGDVFWPGAIAALGGQRAEEVDRSLHELARLGLIKPSRRSSVQDQTEYSFHHTLVREVCYGQLPRADRAVRHERAGAWIQATAPSDALIGYHLGQAYRYRADLRQLGESTYELAFAGAAHLVSDCERALRDGDLTTADRDVDRIVELLEACPAELALGHLSLLERLAKLLVTMGRWQDAVVILTPHEGTGNVSLIRDLGVAICQLHRGDAKSPEYKHGQRLLEAAAAAPHRDLDALASLAGTWKDVDDDRAHRLYRECLDIDPADPYALGNVIEYEVVARGRAIVDEMHPQIVAAQRRCRTQAAAGDNLPWAYFDAAKMSLLLGLPYVAIAAYAKAVQMTTAEHTLVTSMTSLSRLARHTTQAPGFTWAESLLAVGRASLFPSASALEGLRDARTLDGVDGRCDVVVLAGGTDSTADKWISGRADLLLDGFDGFDGVVVSGGTRNGVAGLVSGIRKRRGRRVTTIGYLPSAVPRNAKIDEKYDELRRTDGAEFSIAEALLAWSDLLVSDVSLPKVKMLAVSGGPIAAAEYRIGLALGCTVGVVVGSGREADALLNDDEWSWSPNLVRLNPQAGEIRDFLNPW